VISILDINIPKRDIITLFKITYSHDATTTLRGVDAKLRRRLVNVINTVATDPHGRYANVRKLKGRAGSRIRVGSWRVILTIDDGADTVSIILIAPRGSPYR